MVKQDVKRNGRGQIVSYELNPVSYGEVLLSNTNFQNVEKYGRLSFEANVDFRIVEFANSDILIDPMVDLGFVLFTVQAGLGDGPGSDGLGGSSNTFPFGEAGVDMFEYRVFTRPDGATIPYSWTGTFWQRQ